MSAYILYTDKATHMKIKLIASFRFSTMEKTVARLLKPVVDAEFEAIKSRIPDEILDEKFSKREDDSEANLT